MRSGDFSRYYNISSPIHFLNPLCKILAFIVFVLMAMLGSNISIICSLFIILIYLIIISNVPVRRYFDVLFYLRFFIVFIFIINLFFNGFYGSIIIVSRMCMIVMYYFILLFTTTTNELAYGFYQLFRPLSFFGISVSGFSNRLSLFFNFIPYLFLRFDKVNKSKSSRGFECSILGLFLSFRRSIMLSYNEFQYLFDSLRLKDYSCDRNYVCDYRFHFSDIYMISCHIVVLVFVLIKEVVL